MPLFGSKLVLDMRSKVRVNDRIIRVNGVEAETFPNVLGSFSGQR